MPLVQNREGCVQCRRHSSSRFYDARPYHMHTELSIDVDSPSYGQVICNSCHRRLAKGFDPVTADAASVKASNLGHGFGSVSTAARQLESALGSSPLGVIGNSKIGRPVAYTNSTCFTFDKCDSEFFSDMLLRTSYVKVFVSQSSRFG